MQFRRSGQRDDRRRRVLMDENAASNDKSSKRSRKKSKSDVGAKYPTAARAEHQPRITDFFPKRAYVFSVLLLTALTIIAAINLLHTKIPQWLANIPADDLAAFDLSAPANLATWFSSAILMLAAVGSLQVYALRRHKTDDYKGRYRVWLWASAILVLASMDATAKVHLAMGGLMTQVTGSTSNAGHSTSWLVVYATVMGGLVIRMLIEMRQSRSAVSALLLATAGYTAVVLLQTGMIGVAAPVVGLLIGSASLMVGHLMALFSIWIYARHVYLDVHGQLPVRKPKANKKNSDKKSANEPGRRSPATAPKLAEQAAASINERIDREELSELEEQFDNARRSRKERKAKRPAASKPKLANLDDADIDGEQDYGRLTKSERRALKKHRRQRRAA